MSGRPGTILGCLVRASILACVALAGPRAWFGVRAVAREQRGGSRYERLPSPEAGSPGRPAVHVGTNVQVSRARAEIRHNEVILAIDPANARRLLAASMTGSKNGDSSGVVVYASGDGGATWRPAVEYQGKGADGENYCDPSLAYGPDGSAHLVMLPFSRQDRDGHLMFVRSSDGGETWGKPVRRKGYFDRPFVAVDCSRGKYRGRVYCVTHRAAMASADSGRSFGPVKPFPERPGFVRNGSGNAAVLSDGTLVVLCHAMREDGPRIRPGGVRAGYTTARRSLDGGETFSDEVVVADHGPIKFNSNIPVLAAGPAGKGGADLLAAVWLDAVPAGGTAVMFARSEDRGLSWSAPVAFSEQGGAKSPDAFAPCVAINNVGIAGVSWYHARDLDRGDVVWDVYFRASHDGGRSWEPSVRVTDFPERKDRIGRRSLGGLGHTSGLAADAAGVFHCLWVDGRSGVLQVYTATVAVGARAAPG